MKHAHSLIPVLLFSLCLACIPTTTNTMENDRKRYFTPSFVLKCLGTVGITFFIYKLLHIHRIKKQTPSEEIQSSELVQQSATCNNEWFTNIYNQEVYNKYDNIKINNSHGGVYIQGWDHDHTLISVIANAKITSAHNGFTLDKTLNNKTLNISLKKAYGELFLNLEIKLPKHVNASAIDVTGNITLSNIRAKNYTLSSN